MSACRSFRTCQAQGGVIQIAGIIEVATAIAAQVVAIGGRTAVAVRSQRGRVIAPATRWDEKRAEACRQHPRLSSTLQYLCPAVAGVTANHVEIVFMIVTQIDSGATTIEHRSGHDQ